MAKKIDLLHKKKNKLTPKCPKKPDTKKKTELNIKQA